jgi:hypothetical protein
MVVHQAVSVADPIAAFIDVLEGVQEVDPVLVAFEDGLSLITAGGDVVNCTGIFYAERTSHSDNKVSEMTANVNSKDLTLNSADSPGFLLQFLALKYINESTNNELLITCSDPIMSRVRTPHSAHATPSDFREVSDHVQSDFHPHKDHRVVQQGHLDQGQDDHPCDLARVCDGGPVYRI